MFAFSNGLANNATLAVRRAVIMRWRELIYT